MAIIPGRSIILNKSSKKIYFLQNAHKAKKENSTFQGILRSGHLNRVSLRCQRENWCALKLSSPAPIFCNSF